ncbi:uncharacterized protein LOC143344267 [Colletes latitarsis]|uniref:uncharacterized protein LOC143344267 n=1 Tax=Colletes latitarsis TaxID=2605962 RepID=UPI004035D6E6
MIFTPMEHESLLSAVVCHRRKPGQEFATLYLNADNEKEKESQTTESVRSGHPKGNWIRKLGNYSPTKHELPGSFSRFNGTKTLQKNKLGDSYETISSRGTSESSQSLEMPDLESIIREFEGGFLSPRKQDADTGASKQKNFVKKIVAAFEERYKTYNDLKVEQEARSGGEKVSQGSTPTKTPKRRSAIFSSPFKSASGSPNSTENCENSNDESGIVSTPSKKNSEQSKVFRRSGIFGSPSKMADDEDEAEDGNESSISSTPSKNKDDTKGSRRSRIVTSPIYRIESDLERQDESRRRLSSYFDPTETSLDDTKTVESIDLETSLPEPDETILLDENDLPKTSTMIDESKGCKNEGRKVSFADKAPKIIGAFLKKPIEVEDTSIDWIPITGKKLPRKRSLKRLLASFTGRMTSDKKSKMYSSERNLCEESSERHDSGYDERSCSSSSLTSLVSITEILLHQENSYVEPERRGALRTFRSRISNVQDEDEAFFDAYSTSRKPGKKKLLLNEVPRGEVKLDLGPTYPSVSSFTTMSLDRRSICKKVHSPVLNRSPLTKVPKHPFLNGIPKHPFVSLTKIDKFEDTSDSESVVVKNDLYEVEFRRSCVDLITTTSFSKRSSTGSDYDVPRRFLSKSETEIPKACQSFATGSHVKTIYDVPRANSLERPRSSEYDDPLPLPLSSMKRSASMADSILPDVYAIPCDKISHYATIKPRNNKMYLCVDVLQNSGHDLSVAEKRSF